jgi:hypothetical protein
LSQAALDHVCPHPVGAVIPLRFAYLDFSTLEEREAACRAQDSLNAGSPPTSSASRRSPVSMGGLGIGGAGAIADCLVVMHRLPYGPPRRPPTGSLETNGRGGAVAIALGSETIPLVHCR